MIDLTVVIPYRNGEATLTALLDSLPADLPAIVVDDLSTTPPRYIGRARQVRFLSLKSRGYFSGAVNAGIADCSTDVLVLNQDVLLSGAGWAGLIAEKRAEYALIGDGVMNHPAWPNGYVQGTFMFMRRDAIGKVGLLNERDYPLWGATAEWQLRACRAGYKALPLSPVPGLEHARGNAPFGSAIRETLANEPDARRLFIRTPPAISVIVTSHNYGRYLPDLYNSLFGGMTSLGAAMPQSFQSFEVIIVDDASTDGGDKIADELADAWRGVKVIRNPHRAGTAEAINIGVRASHGKYITHICADDMMTYDRLEYLYREAEKNPGRVIYDDMSWFKNGKTSFRQYIPEYDIENEHIGEDGWETFDSLLKQNFIHTGIFYERANWEAVGGYPAIMANGREDWAMNIRLGRAGYCGLRVPQAGYLYRREGQNRTTTNTGQDWHRFFTQKMHQLFPDLYAGERPDMCCGAKSVSKSMSKSASNGANSANGANGRMMSMAMDSVAPQGMERVEYLGESAGVQYFTGRVSRKHYAFSAIKRKFGFVDKRDLDGLLNLRETGKTLFRSAPAEATPARASVKRVVPEAKLTEAETIYAGGPLPEVEAGTELLAAQAAKAMKAPSKRASKSASKK